MIDHIEIVETLGTSNTTAIICHPHSLMGGTMNNKVVTTLARAFAELGHHTVRFNFRGVGESQGVYDAGIGETHDVLTIWDWVKERRPQDQIWLAGFSFGSYVALRAASQRAPAQLVSIAPPVHNFNFDFSAISRPSCPWLVVQGDQDEVVDPQLVFDWIKTFDAPPELITMPGATHFFHGRLVELRHLLVEALS